MGSLTRRMIETFDLTELSWFSEIDGIKCCFNHTINVGEPYPVRERLPMRWSPKSKGESVIQGSAQK